MPRLAPLLALLLVAPAPVLAEAGDTTWGARSLVGWHGVPTMPCHHPSFSPSHNEGCESAETRYKSAGRSDVPHELHVTPDGSLRIGLGRTWAPGAEWPLAVAFADDGVVWARSELEGIGGPLVGALDAAGATLFVTGPRAVDRARVVAALDARTGEVLWSLVDEATRARTSAAVALSPDGGALAVVTSETLAAGTGLRLLVVRAQDGALVTSARVAHGLFAWDSRALAWSADGARVVLAAPMSDGLVHVLAFDGATGSVLWRSVEDGASTTAWPRALLMTRDGARVLVGGYGGGWEGVAFLSAYDAQTGARLWRTHYDDREGAFPDATPLRDYVAALAQAPGSDRIYAAVTSGNSRVLLAIDGLTGEVQWESGARPTRYDSAGRLAVTPDGSRIVVVNDDQLVFERIGVTVHDATDGALVGAMVFRNGHENAVPSDVALSPDGTRAFVLGRSDTDEDPVRRFATLLTYDVTMERPLVPHFEP